MATIVALGGYLSFHYHALSQQSRDGVDSAYVVLDNVNRVLIAVEDAEVAVRDYVITGDERDLLPLQRATARAAPSYEQLRHVLPAGSVDELERSVSAEFGKLAETIELRRSLGFDAARNAIAQGGAREAMERLRQQMAAIASAERELMVRRQHAARLHERTILRVGIIMVALSIVARLLIAWSVARLRRLHASSPAIDAAAGSPDPR
ncbi:CHASE3 domain-containing protein [Piscinibacter koreensis]|uniref:CHASE3 domain-containing protein n=1 Tax=Piscinibacter koreensis TaxID=2742824 RepID=A0A7Y6NNP4_9BURK|nr:CHASE3 domain-containing protein [Schlegelella koreensis]NUZ06568.1 CHASE3 domain-containing protein [Schlegelella koreensis]